MLSELQHSANHLSKNVFGAGEFGEIFITPGTHVYLLLSLLWQTGESVFTSAGISPTFRNFMPLTPFEALLVGMVMLQVKQHLQRNVKFLGNFAFKNFLHFISRFLYFNCMELCPLTWTRSFMEITVGWDSQRQWGRGEPCMACKTWKMSWLKASWNWQIKFWR